MKRTYLCLLGAILLLSGCAGGTIHAERTMRMKAEIHGIGRHTYTGVCLITHEGCEQHVFT